MEAKIPVFFFQEGEKTIAYSPAFDISTCGNDEADARHMFSEAIAIFIKECEKMGTLEQVLEECGWQKFAGKPPRCSCSEELIKIPMRA